MNDGVDEPTSARRWLAPVVLILMVAGALAWVVFQPREAARLPDSPLIAIGGHTMGGDWSVTLCRLPPGQTREAVQQSCQAILDRLEGAMSTYRADSDVTRFNHSTATDWFDVPQDLANVVWLAQRVSDQSGGAFDVTVGPLVDLWGFGPAKNGLRKGEIPSDDAIAAARALVGYRRLHARLAPPALRKDMPDLHIDLSAIAKGYAAGRVAAALDAQNVADYLVVVGGEVRAKGVSNLARPWHVGIEVPTPDTRRILRQVELRDCGVSTSGDYRNYFDVAGQRFCHEIDPRTGRPVAQALASVSVVHADPAYADAMATALMVLGPIEGEKLAKQLKLAALFVTRGKDGFECQATPEFERLLVGPTTAAAK
jgi:thiamine biosynthesis lipoprotein